MAIWFTAGLTAGSVATYTCAPGYTFVGDVTRTCTAGSWTGVEPRCIPGSLQMGFLLIDTFNILVFICDNLEGHGV